MILRNRPPGYEYMSPQQQALIYLFQAGIITREQVLEIGKSMLERSLSGDSEMPEENLLLIALLVLHETGAVSDKTVLELLPVVIEKWPEFYKNNMEEPAAETAQEETSPPVQGTIVLFPNGGRKTSD
jgi:hypothetical protein